ncbi:hypothetical protein HU200_065611 [Digitaria exilis]|uniref:Uncharacterized protein n=1 Tax=Digitaria exilis TaxID=1010633 RepID=A0A835A2G3_9POAL|nr:hypothetical protein HU200_065611 [Digitaria exilis]
MASMECVLHVLLRVMMRRSIFRLQEVVDMAVGSARRSSWRYGSPASSPGGRRRRSRALQLHTTTPRRRPP